MPKKIFLGFLVSILLLISLVKAINTESQLCLVYFTSTNCPNCAITDPIVLSEWPKKYDNLVIIEYMFEGWGDANVPILGTYAQKYGTMAAVPQLFINEDKIVAGRLDVPEAEDYIKNKNSNLCLLIDKSVSFDKLDLNKLQGSPLKLWSNGRLLIKVGNKEVSNDFLKELLFTTDLEKVIEDSNYKIEKINVEPAPISRGQIDFVNAIEIEGSWILEFNENVVISGKEEQSPLTGEIVESIIEIPLFGKIDAKEMSIPALTGMIAAADAFNPCAFFILTFLLSAMLYAKSRKRVLIVGGIFVFFSGLIYFLFMCAWLNVFLFAGEIILLTMIAGIIALIAGIINIKDFFFFKKGVSLTLPTSQKLKFFEKVKGLIQAQSLIGLVIGTVILAVTINMYELLCTVGFPMIYTRVLTLQNLPTLQYYLYLILYNIIYVIPLAVIVVIFAATLGSRKFTEKGVRNLKLVSGLMILFLGLMLLFKPSMLENVFASFGVVIAAILISGSIIFAKRLMKK